jgi:hypothetical protein
MVSIKKVLGYQILVIGYSLAVSGACLKQVVRLRLYGGELVLLEAGGTLRPMAYGLISWRLRAGQ